jgi:hypothetical protein
LKEREDRKRRPEIHKVEEENKPHLHKPANLKPRYSSHEFNNKKTKNKRERLLQRNCNLLTGEASLSPAYWLAEGSSPNC